eukprot:403367944
MQIILQTFTAYAQLGATSSGDESPQLITDEKLKCYEKFQHIPIIIEGPEQSQDYSYFLVDKNEDLKFLERGIALENLSDIKEQKRLEMEFRVLQRMTQHKGHVKNLFNSPQMEFMKQNRYNEVLPFSHSRVVLKNQPTIIPSDIGIGYNEDLNFYINANYINSFVRGSGEKAFIATQAPIDYTLERFWQMIWEQNTKLIIMLCPLKGPKKEEAICYWVNEQDVSREFGNKAFELTFLSEKQISPGIVQRKFHLKNLNQPDEPPHLVAQLQNTRWEDDDAKADEEHFDDIDKMIKKIKKARRDENIMLNTCRTPPIVVHCSAGIGRTGTVIAIYAILESIEKLQAQAEDLNKLEVDQSIIEAYPLFRKVRVSVFGAVRKMREQRWNMVKRQVQYIFIYEYLERWIRKNLFDLILFGKDDFGDNSNKSKDCNQNLDF